MNTATYDEFLKRSHTSEGSYMDKEYRKLFKSLNEEQSLIDMVIASEGGVPAIAAVMPKIKRWKQEHVRRELSSKERQTIGVMVSSLLAPFGMVVTATKIIPNEVNEHSYCGFTRGAVYAKAIDVPARVELKFEIVELDGDAYEKS